MKKNQKCRMELDFVPKMWDNYIKTFISAHYRAKMILPHELENKVTEVFGFRALEFCDPIPIEAVSGLAMILEEHGFPEKIELGMSVMARLQGTPFVSMMELIDKIKEKRNDQFEI